MGRQYRIKIEVTTNGSTPQTGGMVDFFNEITGVCVVGNTPTPILVIMEAAIGAFVSKEAVAKAASATYKNLNKITSGKAHCIAEGNVEGVYIRILVALA